MKKTWTLMSALLLVAGLAACGGKSPKTDPTGGKTPTPTPTGEKTPTPTPSVTPTETPTPTPTVEEKVYCLAGSFNGWAAGDLEYALTQDAENANRYYIENVAMEAGAEFKVTDTKGNWHPTGMGNNSKVVESGLYTVEYLASSETITATKTGDYVPSEHSYYVVGSFNGWGDAVGNEDYLMSKDSDGHYSLVLDLAAGAELKVTDEKAGSWYGTASGGNVLVTEAGSYLVSFVLEPGEGVDPVTISLGL